MSMNAIRRSMEVWAVAGVLCLLAGPSAAALPVSLDQVPIPRPERTGTPGKIQGGTHDLAEIIPPQGEAAAIRLGKALFWDMQVGSGGDLACASCHFKAGTDDRVTNTLNLGADGTFEVGGPNHTLTAGDFPFRKLVDPDNRGTGGVDPNDPAVLSDADDVVGAQGVPRTLFSGLRDGSPEDAGNPEKDRVFHQMRRNARQVTGRNTPSTINAVFNFANFLDGRANHFFNGVNPFGPQDPNARVWVDEGAGLTQERLLLNNSSLASQAVGPPNNEVEMAWLGRSFPELGRKMLGLQPLALQVVHRDDSVLGTLANTRATGNPAATGLATTYGDLIRAAFAPRFWQSSSLTPEGFTQMEANFSLFFGLAVQMYESTLVSDDTPFDRFLLGDVNAMTDRQLRGMNIFFSGRAGCSDCHLGPELTGASITRLLDPGEAGLIEVMPMADGLNANYDLGFYNIGVRPSAEDRGRGGKTPFGNPLAFSRHAVLNAGLATGNDDIGFLNFDPAFAPSPGCIPDPLANPPRLCPPVGIARVAVEGAFKVPGLRNVELTGPYFHNGGTLTLRQAVEFYDRGGDFNEANRADLDPVIRAIGLADEDVDALVDFLLALTDERVRQEAAPFDHPEIRIPDGHGHLGQGHPKRHGGTALETRFRTIPAVGAAGRAAQGLPPLRPFLWDGTEDFHFKPSF